MKSSRWCRYISTLPRQPYSLLYWYTDLKARIFTKHPDLYLEEVFNMETFRWSFGILFSRLVKMFLDYDKSFMGVVFETDRPYQPGEQEVPILMHKGKSIIGSLVMLEYIEDTWGGYHLHSKDPYERAHARFLANFIDVKRVPAFRSLFWNEGGVMQNSMEQSKVYLSILDEELTSKKFFGGENIGFVDIAANYMLPSGLEYSKKWRK